MYGWRNSCLPGGAGEEIGRYATTWQTGSFYCQDEYAQVCRQMAATLARKRPSLLLGGRVNTWAAAIVHTVGSVNFLFDKSQELYMRADELAASFGLSKSTVGNKSKQVKDSLKIDILDV